MEKEKLFFREKKEKKEWNSQKPSEVEKVRIIQNYFLECRFKRTFFELESSDNAATSSEKPEQPEQPEGDLLKMAQFQTNTESLMYLQECINDLQDQSFTRLQLSGILPFLEHFL